MKEEEFKQIEEFYKERPSQKYLEKYGIHLLGHSISFRKFLVLILNLKEDKKEDLNINFDFNLKTNFGRTYLRYSLYLKDDFTTQEVYIQVAYDEENFLNGSLFTLVNTQLDINGYDYELTKKRRELIEECILDFITNRK